MWRPNSYGGPLDLLRRQSGSHIYAALHSLTWMAAPIHCEVNTMAETRHECDDGVRRLAARVELNGHWKLVVVVGWSAILFLALPFSVFPIPVRLGISLISLVALYAAIRSVRRGWVYAWVMIPVLFWIYFNWIMWTCPYWSAADYKKAFDVRKTDTEESSSL